MKLTQDKRMKSPKIGMNEWIELLQSAHEVKPDVIPEGFFTTVQLAQKVGKSEPVMCKKLRLLLSQGKVERKKFRVFNGKYVRGEYHYRIKK